MNKKGRQKNEARSAAIYLCRKHARYSLNEFAEYFGLNHYGSVSGLVKRFEYLLQEDRSLARRVNRLLKVVNEKI